MEPTRGSSCLSISAGKRLLRMAVTIVFSRSAYAYAPSLSSTISSNKSTRIIPTMAGSDTRFGESSCSIRSRSLKLFSTDDSPQEELDSIKIRRDDSVSTTSATSNVTASAIPEAQFGESTPMRRKKSSADSAQFGDVVSISRPSSSSTSPSILVESTPKTASSKPTGLSDVEMLKQRRIRNIAVAILSTILAVGNYAYQWTHPITPIQLLVNMERSSAPLSDIGKNSKPTVIDFWAPWCENCRYMAPTIFKIEESYKDRVNFVMVNGDDPKNWPLIEALGVDAIPHLSLLESDGTVDTALIGAVPKEWLSRDLDVLLDNAKSSTEVNQTPKKPLPYQMLDVFANRPENRKIANLDSIFESDRR